MLAQYYDLKQFTKEQRKEIYADILAEDAKNLEVKALHEPRASHDYSLRVVESWLTEDGETRPQNAVAPSQEWVTMMKDPPFPLKKSKTLNGFEYQLEHQPFKALGPVTEKKATREAIKQAEQIRKVGCDPVVILDWMQEDRCRTSYYKKNSKDKNVYEPLTCEDQGINEPLGENQKMYFIVLFGYCPKIAEQVLSKEN